MSKIRKFRYFQNYRRYCKKLMIEYSKKSIDTSICTCVCVCVYVHKVSRSYNTAVTEDDSAKPRLRFPVRERFRLYVYRYVAGLVHSTLDTYTVIFSPLEEREYQKLEEKAGMHCTQKKNWGNNRRRN